MKRFILLAGAAASIATIWSGSAATQTAPGSSGETGSLITRRSAQISGESKADARLTAKRFGECTLARSPAAAAQLVDMAVDAPGFDKHVRRVIHEDCLSAGELRLPGTVIRGTIFEALYTRDFGRSANPNLKSAPTFDYTKPYSRPFSGSAESVIGLAIVGDCAVRTDPVAAHQLVTSIPGTQLEDRAVAQVARHLPGCVPPNKAFKFSRSIIRASVAEALYRLSSSVRQARGAAQ